MAPRKRVLIEVAPDGMIGWTISIDGELVASYLRQRNAEAAARRIGQAVKVGRAELVVKKRDGTIGDKDSFGADPRKTRG